MMENQDEERLVYSVREACTLLGLSKNSVYARIREGVIPSIRVGARLLIPRVALRRWLESASGNDGQG